jgi:hypothetical protein
MDFLKLAAGLSVYNGGEYDGYVIGRAALELSGKIVKTANRIRVKRKNYVVMDVTGYGADQEITGRLEVTMVKPPAGFKVQAGEPEKEDGACLFTQEQVDRYLLAVQDTNPIHRGKAAVVPGLMLVDFLLQQEVPVQKIRFVEPLLVGTSFVVEKDWSGIRILSVNRKICYAKL